MASSFYPNESISWGWLIINLKCDCYTASKQFYQALDFTMIDGSDEKTWAVLNNRTIEIHLFSGHITADMLNYRGGDAAAIHKKIKEFGWPISAQFGPNSFIVKDPDGREVFFDLGASEAKAFESGQPLSVPATTRYDTNATDQPLNLGQFCWYLSCEDPKQTADFYQKLDWILVEHDSDYRFHNSPPAFVLARPGHVPSKNSTAAAMFFRLFDKNSLNRDTLAFEKADLDAIAPRLDQLSQQASNEISKLCQIQSRTGDSISVADPDNRPIMIRK